MKTIYIIKGINDDTDTCSCCGKTGLKRVVWIAPVVDGEELLPDSFGTTCALRVTGRPVSRSRAVNEKTIYQVLVESVNDKIVKAREGFVSHQNYLLPADLAIKVERNGMPIQDALRERNQRFPVLNYLSGSISLEQAARC